MYSRDEIKALTDKVLNMTKADAVEVSFDGGERSATRWANSSITVNMVQYDQQLTINVRHGAKQGSASTREFDDESLKAMVRSEEHTSELQYQIISYAVFCLKKKRTIGSCFALTPPPTATLGASRT